jgi:hypothetical protein
MNYFPEHFQFSSELQKRVKTIAGEDENASYQYWKAGHLLENDNRNELRYNKKDGICKKGDRTQDKT